MCFFRKSMLFGFLFVSSIAKIYSSAENNNDHYFQSTQCGICYRPHAWLPWPNQLSNFAHPECHKLIRPCEQHLMRLFAQEKPFDQDHYHRIAVGAVQIACGGNSLLSFYTQHEEKGLRDLFNNTGVFAILKNIEEQLSILSSKKHQRRIEMLILGTIEDWSPEQLKEEIKRRNRKLKIRLRHLRSLFSLANKFFIQHIDS